MRPLHSKDNLEQEVSKAAAAAAVAGFPMELLDVEHKAGGVLFNCVVVLVACFVKCNEPLLLQDAVEELTVRQVLEADEVLQVSVLFSFVTVFAVQLEAGWVLIDDEDEGIEVCAVNEVIVQVFKELL